MVTSFACVLSPQYSGMVVILAPSKKLFGKMFLENSDVTKSRSFFSFPNSCPWIFRLRGRSRTITGRMVRWSRRTMTSTTISLPKTENWALRPSDKRSLEKVIGRHNQRLLYLFYIFVGVFPPSAPGSLVQSPHLHLHPTVKIRRRSLSWRFARLLLSFRYHSLGGGWIAGPGSSRSTVL